MPIVLVDVRVGQIDMVAEIVVPDRRAEQKRLRTIEQQLEIGEVARIAVEQAIGPTRGRADIAMAVEDGKGVVVLEGAPRPGGGAGGRDVEWRFAGRYRLVLGRFHWGYQE